MTRVVTEAVEVGGVTLAPGATVVYSPYLMHRHPRFHSDPESFDPDRWVRQEADDLPRGSFVPFGGGARKCIGETFGMTEAVLALATIAARWRLLTVRRGRVRPALQATLTPKSLVMQPVARC
ncbi:pentalenene oxygenase [Lentzea xinjiangensis]|uniref:Pentalenene oxygenase n=1 Tax=Lentzea xinjiangensis TaxID=402600 RepID=A0A1H9TRT2_9PSEU|nr:pentalenene oxygenase [Lentzea xinjiangensis]